MASVASKDTHYIFFQDINGSLRQAVHSASTQSWITDLSVFVPNTNDARNNTPLTAFITGSLELEDEDEVKSSLQCQ